MSSIFTLVDHLSYTNATRGTALNKRRSIYLCTPLQTGLYLSPVTADFNCFLCPHRHNAKPAPHTMRGLIIVVD